MGKRIKTGERKNDDFFRVKNIKRSILMKKSGTIFIWCFIAIFAFCNEKKENKLLAKGFNREINFFSKENTSWIKVQLNSSQKRYGVSYSRKDEPGVMWYKAKKGGERIFSLGFKEN